MGGGTGTGSWDNGWTSEEIRMRRQTEKPPAKQGKPVLNWLIIAAITAIVILVALGVIAA